MIDEVGRQAWQEQVGYRQQAREDEPRAEWIQEQLREMYERLRER